MNPSEIDLILTQDWNGLNAGSFFIRNTPMMRLFVDLWNDPIFIDYAQKNWLLRGSRSFSSSHLPTPDASERIDGSSKIPSTRIWRGLTLLLGDQVNWQYIFRAVGMIFLIFFRSLTLRNDGI